MENTTYELRALKSEDIFPMIKILNKVGVREFKDCLEKISIADGKENAEKIGTALFLEVSGIVITNLPSCENDIYTFLSNLSGMATDEIADLPLVTFAEMVVDVIKKEEFKDFIKVVSKLFK